MRKYLIPIGLFFTLIMITAGVFFFTKKNTPEIIELPSTYEYFWGDGCPHCAVVAEFLETWEGKDKVPIEKKEVWKNRENADLQNQRAKYCGLKPSETGVPFLFTPEGTCISGDEPIINFLNGLEK